MVDGPMRARGRHDDVGEVDRASCVSISTEDGSGDDLHVDAAGIGEEEVGDAADETDIVDVLCAAFV